ncbi:MAG: phosphatase PAP2 family protein [Caldilineaceae bacterium]
MDAIVAWDAKYAYNRPRPSGITPLIVEPASPSYPSEHAAAAGAAATVLAYLFPTRPISLPPAAAVGRAFMRACNIPAMWRPV